MSRALEVSDDLILRYATAQPKITLQDLQDKLNDHFKLTDADKVAQFDRIQKSELRGRVRRLMRDGLPMLWNLVEIGPDGERTHYYKAMDRFTLEDYKQVYEDLKRRSRKLNKDARKVKRRALEKFPGRDGLFA